jgi:hypothetical protein
MIMITCMESTATTLLTNTTMAMRVMQAITITTMTM